MRVSQGYPYLLPPERQEQYVLFSGWLCTEPKDSGVVTSFWEYKMPRKLTGHNMPLACNDPATVARIIKAAKAGVNASGLRERFGISASQLSSILSANGISLRKGAGVDMASGLP